MLEVEDIFTVDNTDVWSTIVTFTELYFVVAKSVCDAKVAEIVNDETVACSVKFDINDVSLDVTGVEKFAITDENSTMLPITLVVSVSFCSNVKSAEDTSSGEVIFFVVSVISLVGVPVLKIVSLEDTVKLIIGVVTIEPSVVWTTKLSVIPTGVDVKLKTGDVTIELSELVMLKLSDIACDVITEFSNDIVLGVEI